MKRFIFFAAYSGEWAKALANQGLVVDTSDINDAQVNKLNADSQKLNSVVRRPAEMHNIIPNYYDWSISYEPVPLFGSNSLEFTLRTSLLNKKGLKLIFSSEFNTLLKFI